MNIVEEDRVEEGRPRQCERCRRFDLFVIGWVVSFYFSSLLIVFTMPIRKDRPFKSPRLAKPIEVTKDSDEDGRRIAQTLETTKQSHVHRKDNSEWGKRMEKQLGEMDKRREEADKSKTTADIVTQIEKGQTPLLNKRKSVFRRLNTALDNTVVSEDRSKHSSEIGKTVARDFGDAGVFTGEIVQVDYDSEDVDKVEPIYAVQ